MNLNVTELKVFIPCQDYNISKSFYRDMGFVLKSDSDGVAYFAYGNSSFLLQDYYHPELAGNLMIHLLVENATDWHQKLASTNLADKYSITISELELRPWRMIDFTMTDPSGVLWRIANNI
jgi:catechol 2,3-dioxygenase-like lactoylglutathione lyase family enzyme